MNAELKGFALSTKGWAVHSFAAEQDPDLLPNRFVIHAPAGLRVVAIATRGERIMVTALAPVGVAAVAQGFWFVPPDEVLTPLIGRSLGQLWPVVLPTPSGPALMFAIEDRPWPETKVN